MGLFSATEIDTNEVARRYAALLLDGEEVLIAFKTLRDIAFLTAVPGQYPGLGWQEGIDPVHPLSLDHPLQLGNGRHLRP